MQYIHFMSASELKKMCENRLIVDATGLCVCEILARTTAMSKRTHVLEEACRLGWIVVYEIFSGEIA